MLKKTVAILVLLINIHFQYGMCYSTREDARIITEYKRQQRLNAASTADSGLNHAKIARELVNQASWASVGTLSVNSVIKDYPMVNIISVNDNDETGKSTGRIQFLLTDLDFTGPDWRQNNKSTMLFSDEQRLHCSRNWPYKIDPMEPTCARTIISGQIVKMNKNDTNYDGAIVAFVQKHPAAKEWLKAHTFYLCELDIKNIFVLDFYGGPHIVSTEDYYNTAL